jgi:1,4-alpha-glucan branching enzyme
MADDTVRDLLEARVHDPFSVLGMHREGEGLSVRAWVRGAEAVTVVPRDGDKPVPLARRADGLFEGPMGRSGFFAYELLVRRHGAEERIRDPYSFWLQLSEYDLDLFRAGHHQHLGDILGAHVLTIDGVEGTRFAVWAPHAERVSVVGDWNGFDGHWHPMRPRPPYGVWELFLPGVVAGARYKFELRGPGGELRIKADPYARCAEQPPATASVVWREGGYAWRDRDWLEARLHDDQLAKPMAIYECHLGSWMRGTEPDAWPNYRTLAPLLIAHCRKHGFTHLELLPLAQHPFEGSWGYQVTGQYAPNSRHGSPDDLRAFVDECHAAGIAVIVDFVPGHFPKDDFSLARFDGRACYEYEDPREGEHRTWGTMVFNYRRPEVRNFLVAAALHWIREFHIDGLRVDAVSSMLYRDYDREAGAWVANQHGGNENLEAVSFLQELTTTVRDLHRGVLLIAEESTAWKGVTAPTAQGGLGFDLKWNMGWMHDTLRYLAQDPLMRPGCHDWITFHQWYAYDDRWILPLSHDEVVHGKKSLVDKPWGDWWQRLAQLRLLYGYQVGVPGRPLLFQGAEFAEGREWDWSRREEWQESQQGERAAIGAWLAAVLGLYRAQPALHRNDDSRSGFRWIDSENRAESVLAFLRSASGAGDVLVACNFTPIPRHAYPLAVPQVGEWTMALSSDEARFGGSGAVDASPLTAAAEPRGAWPATLRVTLPPLGVVFLLAPLAGKPAGRK